MPQVPYRPYPQISVPTPGEAIHVETPGAAFGENIARSVEGLGGSMEKAGGEIFQRAVALQQLANETAARDADSQYAQAQGQAHADFISNNPGLSARQNLPGFYKSSDELRKSFRANLPNDEARRMYDASSLGFFIRNVNSAALHAGQAFKSGVLKSAESADFVTTHQWTTPGSDEEADAKVRALEQNSHTIVGLEGQSEITRQAELLKKTQEVYTQQLITMGQTDPQKALDKLEADPERYGEHYPQLRQHLWQQNEVQTGSRIAEEIVKSSKGDTEESMMEKVPDAIKGLDKGDDKFRRSVENQIRALISHERTQGIYDRALARDNISHMLEASPDETKASNLWANPEFQKQATAAGYTPEKIQAILNHRNKLQGDQFYHDFANQADHLKGMAYNDREAFYNTDFWDPKYHLSVPQIKSLTAMRAGKGDPLNSPQVKQITRWMVDNYGSNLQDLGVLHKTTTGTLAKGKNWNAFTGHIATAVEEYEATNNKPLNDPAYIKDTLAPQLMQRGPAGWFSKGDPIITTPTPNELNKKVREITADAKKQGLPAPDPAQVQRAMRQSMWKDFFEKQQEQSGGGK